MESIAVVCALVGKRTEGFGKSMVGNNRLRHIRHAVYNFESHRMKR